MTYAPTREEAQRRALDVVMVEHRGFGLSRRAAGRAERLWEHLASMAWDEIDGGGITDLFEPALVDRISRSAPDAVRVTLPDTGHGVRDRHPLAALHIAHPILGPAQHGAVGVTGSR